MLKGEVQVRCKELIVQVCDTRYAGHIAEDVRIKCPVKRVLKGVVSKDHVHMHVEYPPALSVSDLMKRVKGRTSRLLQKEFPHLEKRYWGKHLPVPPRGGCGQ